MEEPVRDDAAHLKSLRLAAGLDIAELAAKANLSSGQVRQLEDGGESLFYSPQIKHQSLRRVIRLLESPAQMANDSAQREERQPRSGQSVIDDIIRLSEQNLKSHVVTSAVKRPGGSHGKLYTVMAGLVFISVLAWQFNRHQSQALYTEWVEPMTAKVLKPPAGVVETDVQPNQIENSPVPSLAVTTEVIPSPVTQSVSASEQSPSLPVPTPVITSEKPSTTKATEPAPSAVSSNDCSQINTEPTPIATSIHSKAGTYVHLFSNKAIQVCVDDGKKAHTIVTLSPGVGRSVYGVAPWTVTSSEMKSLQIYFQGGKVLLPPDAGARIYLKEQAVSP